MVWVWIFISSTTAAVEALRIVLVLGIGITSPPIPFTLDVVNVNQVDRIHFLDTLQVTEFASMPVITARSGNYINSSFPHFQQRPGLVS